MPHVEFGGTRSAQVVFLALLAGVISAEIGSESGSTRHSPIVIGKVARADYGVVVAAHADAACVGAEILRAGGSAMDAATAAASTYLGLVDPRRPGQAAGY
jgi:gamma-glutamyltranspeptidase